MWHLFFCSIGLKKSNPAVAVPKNGLCFLYTAFRGKKGAIYADHDYGYFGKGAVGYAQYMQCFKRCFGLNGGGNSGCLPCVLAVIGIGTLPAQLVR